MGERTLFPNASTKATLAYCWSQMRPDRAAFAGCCSAIALGTLANAVAAPLIFSFTPTFFQRKKLKDRKANSSEENSNTSGDGGAS